MQRIWQVNTRPHRPFEAVMFEVLSDAHHGEPADWPTFARRPAALVKALADGAGGAWPGCSHECIVDDDRAVLVAAADAVAAVEEASFLQTNAHGREVLRGRDPIENDRIGIVRPALRRILRSVERAPVAVADRGA